MEEEEQQTSTNPVASSKRRKGVSSSEKAQVKKAPAKKRPSPDISQTRKSKKSRSTTITSKQQFLSKEKEPEEDLAMSSDSTGEEASTPPVPTPSNTSSTSVPPPPPPEPPKTPTNPSEALQALLRRSGLDEFVPTNSLSRSRLTAMIDGVKAEGDVCRQMDSLMELCDYLSMGTEETLGGFRAESVVPALVNLLNYEDNPEVMLYAARALTYMMEALPASCASVVQHGAIPVFCEKLLVISYIDVAEQSLQALDKLSIEHPNPILRAGGLLAVLSFLDFFSIGVKRSAVQTAANICRGVTPESIDHISQVVPLLTGLLSDPDQKAVEGACLCFARLAESFQEIDSHLQTLASAGLVSNVMRIVAANPPLVNPATHALLVRMLTNLAHGSVSLAMTMLQEGTVPVIQAILANDAATTRSSELLQEILSLVNELLPPLPGDFIPVQILATFSARPFSRMASLRRKKYESSTGPKSDLQLDGEARIQLFSEQSHLLQNMAENLFEIVVRVHGSTVNPAVRNKCLLVILKFLLYATSETLTEVLRNIRISSFVAAQLASRDQSVVLVALKMAEVLFQKLPNIFNKYFKREGVLFEVEKLSRQESKLLSKQPAEESSPQQTRKAESKEPSSPTPTTPQRSTSVSSSSVRSPTSSLLNFLAGHPASPNTATPTSSLPPLKDDDLKALIVSAAKQFKTNFFGSSLLEEDLDRLIATDELVQLRSLSTKLHQLMEGPIASDDERRKVEEEELNILLQIKELLTRAESVSTFEFLQSKISVTLTKYLSGHDKSVPLDRRRQRWRTFSLAFSSSTYEESSNPSAGLLYIVRRLQDAINTREKFQVLLHETGAGAGSGLSFLTQPFKLKLQKESGDKTDLKDYSTNVVLIEPLATINAIEDFLWSRVKPPTPSLGSSPSSSSSSSSLLTGENKVPASPTSRKELTASTERAAKPAESPEPATPPSSGSNSNLRASNSLATTPTDAQDEEYLDEYDDWEGGEAEAEDHADEPVAGVHDVRLSESGAVDNASATRPLSTSSGRDIRSSRGPSSPSATVSTYSSSATSTSTATPSDPATKQHRLTFLLDGQPLPYTTTIFQAVQRIVCEQNQEAQTQPLPRMWEGVYTLRYRLASSDAETQETSSQSSSESIIQVRPLTLTPLDTAAQQVPPRPNLTADDTYESLALLYLLEMLNRLNAHLLIPGKDKRNLFSQIPNSEFINEKITAKLARQLQDPLALCSGSLPDWCRVLTHHYAFLFPSESRRIYFNSTSFGIVRALHSLQQRNESLSVSSEQNEGLRVGRISRQKVRVMRNRMLESAIKVMDLFAKHKAILEVEYFGEVGTGLGPTLEFYTCVSEELQDRKLKLWSDQSSPKTSEEHPDGSRTIEDPSRVVQAPGGLFPAPINPALNTSEVQRILQLFQFAGSFVAKALLDSRILDMPFSNAFYKWMLGKEVSFDDLKEIAPEIGRSLQPLVNIVNKKREVQGGSASSMEQLVQIQEEELKCVVEDLALDFTFPGQPDWELMEGGSNIPVTIHNLEEYVELVTQNYLVRGVERSLDSFRKGFNGVFPMDHLGTFTVEELDSLICGEKGKWEATYLGENIKCDHGYSHASRAVEFFLDILSEFDLEQQRKFLLFVTGSPKLPVGGFRNLTPKLTIVRKDMQMENPDNYLPTVSSCFHYLKLPDYSNKQIMKEKLLRAIELGQGSFHLT